MTAFYDRLVALTRERKALFESGSKEQVAEAFSFLHAVMVASEDLCAEAKMIVCEMTPPTEFIYELADFYRDKRMEERGHASWLGEDLRSAGYGKPETPDFLAAAAVGTQYYLINHVHPVALLGYMVYLECDPMPMETVELLEERYGKSLLRTQRFHAGADVQHSQDLREICELVPPALQGIIVQSLGITAEFWQTAATRHAVGLGQIVFKKPSMERLQ